MKWASHGDGAPRVVTKLRPAWHASLEAELESLNRWFRGRFVPEPAPTDEVVPAKKYHDLDYLRAAIIRGKFTTASPPLDPTGENIDVDIRIAVSRFTRQYSSSLHAVALTALANGVGIDCSADRVRVIVRANIPFLCVVDVPEGEPLRCAERPTSWPVEGKELATLGELRAFVWRKLYAENLAPLFERVLAVTKVSTDLCWTNAAEWVANVSDAADEYLDPERARPYYEDRVALLAAPQVPGIPGPNPLRGLMDWPAYDAPDFPHGVQTRRICCVTYMLPDRMGRLCQNCGFLPLDDRAALIRERHNVPMGTPGGPAEKHSITVGRRKLGLDK
jgi:hypothetical protein